MIKYEKIENEFGNKSILRHNENGSQSWIPLDEANSDYQSYLEYLADAQTK